MNASTQIKVSQASRWVESWKTWWSRQTKARMIGFCACWLTYCAGFGLLLDHASVRMVFVTLGLWSMVSTFIMLIFLFRK